MEKLQKKLKKFLAKQDIDENLQKKIMKKVVKLINECCFYDYTDDDIDAHTQGTQGAYDR